MAARTLLACAAILLLPAACGGRETASSEPTQTASGPPTVEQFGYIRSVSTNGEHPTIAFDDAEWLTGKEAQKAAVEDGEIPPGEPVPNDYYIRNPDKSTRTLEVAPDAQITAKRCSICRNGKPGDLEDFLASFDNGRQTYADPYRGKYSQYWLTIENGRVVAIDEQYVP